MRAARHTVLALAGTLAMVSLAREARASDTANTVLFELQGHQVESGLVQQLSNRLRERVAVSQGYRPVARALVELRLLTAPFDQTGQCGARCQSLARDLLSAEWLIDGLVLKTSVSCAVRLRLIDPINGTARQEERAGKCDLTTLGRTLDETWDRLRLGSASGAQDKPEPLPFSPAAPTDIGSVLGNQGASPVPRRSGRAVRAAVVAQASGPGARAAEAALRSGLQDAHIDVMDVDPALAHAAGAAKRLAKSADYLVRVRVATSTGPALSGSTLLPQLATLEWDVVSTASGRIVRSGTSDGRSPHIDATLGGAKAAKAAALDAAPEIARTLLGEP